MRTNIHLLSALMVVGGLTARVLGDTGPVAHPPAPAPNHPTATLSTDRASYRMGSAVLFEFVVKNTTTGNLHYDFSTSQQFDISVKDAQGQSWRWSQDRSFAQAFTLLDLKPGQSKSYHAEWSLPNGLSLGTYTATANLTPSVHPAIRGGVTFNPDRDPNNIGGPVHSGTETGAVVQVNTTPGFSASTTFVVVGK